jgi:hypothetical protein
MDHYQKYYFRYYVKESGLPIIGMKLCILIIIVLFLSFFFLCSIPNRMVYSARVHASSPHRSPPNSQSKEICCFAANPFVVGGCIFEKEKEIMKKENNLEQRDIEIQKQSVSTRPLSHSFVPFSFSSDRKFVQQPLLTTQNESHHLKTAVPSFSSPCLFIPDYQEIHSLLHNDFPKIDILEVAKFCESPHTAPFLTTRSSLFRLFIPELYLEGDKSQNKMSNAYKTDVAPE